MDIRKITDKTSVSPQITVEDMAAIKDAGFRAIICNRPDGEGADQPSFEEIEAAANADEEDDEDDEPPALVEEEE